MQSYVAPTTAGPAPLDALKASGRRLAKKGEFTARRETKVMSHIQMFESMSKQEEQLDSSFGADDYGDSY